MTGKRPLLIAILALAVLSPARAICPYDANCINNPITGRNPVAPQGGAVVAPFSRYSTNQLNPEFNANPGVIKPISNPFAPAPKTTGDFRDVGLSAFQRSGRRFGQRFERLQ